MHTVLITGGSRGIGAACVQAFARAGWQVAFTYRENRERAGALARQTGALALCADLREDLAVRRAAAEVVSHFGAVDALVCNAGVAEQKMFQDITDEDWQRMLDVNLLGAVRTIRACLPDMLHAKRGSIVTVSSIWGQSGASCESHYAASKAALIGLTRSLALELGPSGIRVNCVAPGVIDTDMNAVHSAETMQALAAETPLGRIGTTDEVADSILYLCSDRASFITGQVLGVTGNTRSSVTKVLPQGKTFCCLCGAETKIVQHTVINALRKAVGIVAQPVGVRRIAQVGKLNQDCGHACAAQHIQAGVDAHAVIPRTDALDNAAQHMLGQPVGLGVLLVNIDLAAVDCRIDIGIAVDADKVVRRPAVGQVHARG